MSNKRKIGAVFMMALLLCVCSGFTSAQLYEEDEPSLEGIMIVSLPDAADGILTYGGQAIWEGESVPADRLMDLAFTAVNSTLGTYSYIPVYTDGSIGQETVSDISAKVNAQPSADNHEVSTYRNLTVSGVFPISDDSGSLICQVLTQPSMGIVTVEGNSFTYTPYQNKTGTDSFSYIVRDSYGAWSQEATITINIDKQKSDVFYSDLVGSAAQFAAIRLAEEGIYVGEQIGSAMYFRPQDVISRGEFIALTMALMDYEPAVSAATLFADDESIPAWTRSYVVTALREGIIAGSQSEEAGVILRADEGITLAEAAVILDNAGDFASSSASAWYKEQADVPAWAEASVASLAANGIYALDTAGALEGGRVLTRGDAAQILLSVMGYQENQAVKTGFFSWITM